MAGLDSILALRPPEDDAPAAGGPEGVRRGGIDVDALCDMLSVGAYADTPGQDVAEFLGLLPALGDQSQQVASASSGARGPARDAPHELPPLQALCPREPDLPLPDEPLPEDASPESFVMVATFDLQCHVDLKAVAFGVRVAEYNPRKHSSVSMRLRDPRATALVRASGKVSIAAKATEEELKSSAKKVARLIQRCGHEGKARFCSYRVVSILAKARFGFPVRLDALAEEWPRNAVYEPEVYCSCVFRTIEPKVSYNVTSGGMVTISGLREMAKIREAMHRLYYAILGLKSRGWTSEFRL